MARHSGIRTITITCEGKQKAVQGVQPSKSPENRGLEMDTRADGLDGLEREPSAPEPSKNGGVGHLDGLDGFLHSSETDADLEDRYSREIDG